MKRILLAGLFFVALPGCSTAFGSREMARPAFPVEEYAGFDKRKGTATITGQVIMRTALGPKFAGGEEVWLNPVTSYSTFWYTHRYQGRKSLAAGDERQEQYLITTHADGVGNFRFESVPAGDYYLVSYVRWVEPGSSLGSLISHYEPIAERIRVEDGARIQKILTREY